MKRLLRIALDSLYILGCAGQIVLWLGLLAALTPIYVKY